jgi:hypothetical protein
MKTGEYGIDLVFGCKPAAADILIAALQGSPFLMIDAIELAIPRFYLGY